MVEVVEEVKEFVMWKFRPAVTLLYENGKFVIASSFSKITIPIATSDASEAETVFRSINGTQSKQDVSLLRDSVRLRGLFEDTLQECIRKNAVYKPGQLDDLNKLGSLDSQNRYFSRYWIRDAETRATSKMQSSSIVILGVGGVGGTVAMLLARAGAGRLILIDPDIVDITNINRQLLYDTSDVGRSKVAVAADRLRTVSENIRIETHQCRITSLETLANLCPTGSVLVVPILDLLMSHSAFSAELWTSAARYFRAVFYSYNLRVGPLVVGDPILGYMDMFDTLANKVRELNSVPIMRSETPNATLSSSVSFVSSIIASELIKYITDIERADTLDGVLVVHPRNYQVTLHALW